MNAEEQDRKTRWASAKAAYEAAAEAERKVKESHAEEAAVLEAENKSYLAFNDLYDVWVERHRAKDTWEAEDEHTAEVWARWKRGAVRMEAGLAVDAIGASHGLPLLFRVVERGEIRRQMRLCRQCREELGPGDQEANKSPASNGEQSHHFNGEAPL